MEIPDQVFSRSVECADPTPSGLFYTSNMPIMLQSALSTQVFLLSQMLYNRFSDNLLVRLIGVWETIEGSGSSAPRCQRHRLLHLSPPLSVYRGPLGPDSHGHLPCLHDGCLRPVFQDLGRSVWIVSPRDAAAIAEGAGLVMAGHRDQSMYRELKRVIPAAAAFGGAIIGPLLSVASDLMGGPGKRNQHLARRHVSCTKPSCTACTDLLLPEFAVSSTATLKWRPRRATSPA